MAGFDGAAVLRGVADAMSPEERRDFAEWLIAGGPLPERTPLQMLMGGDRMHASLEDALKLMPEAEQQRLAEWLIGGGKPRLAMLQALVQANAPIAAPVSDDLERVKPCAVCDHRNPTGQACDAESNPSVVLHSAVTRAAEAMARANQNIRTASSVVRDRRCLRLVAQTMALVADVEEVVDNLIAEIDKAEA